MAGPKVEYGISATDKNMDLAADRSSLTFQLLAHTPRSGCGRSAKMQSALVAILVGALVAPALAASNVQVFGVTGDWGGIGGIGEAPV